MKRKFYSLLMIGAMLLPTACSYDDTDVWNAVNDLDNRVDNLEQIVAQLNNDVSTLHKLMQGKLFITSVENMGNGVHKVNFISDTGESSYLEIRDGKDGANGAQGPQGDKGDKGDTGATGPQGPQGDKGDKGDKGDTGAPGKDGKDGVTPVVSLKQDSDGNWYWTINGEYLLDANGQKVRANGTDGATGPQGPQGDKGDTGATGAAGADGKDGVDGKDGKNGIAPAFRIENGMWYVSLDRGLTWTELGVAQGADGDSFFKDACQSEDGTLAYLTLADGTVLTLPIYRQFDIAFDIQKALVHEGQTKDIAFTITGMTKNTTVEALGKKGWDADAVVNADGTGVLTVSAPVTTGPGKVIVLVSDGAKTTIMRTLSFVSGQVLSSTQAVDAVEGEKAYNVEVRTNVDFTVNVPAEAAWVKVINGRDGELRTETFQISVERNDSPEAREALLTLENNGTVVETIRVVQDGQSLDSKELVFRVDPAKGDAKTGVCLPLSYVTKGSSVFVDWGDGSDVQELKASSATSTSLVTADRYPKHVYADQSRQYTVRIWGGLTQISGTSASYTKGIVGIVQWGTGLPYTSINFTNNNDIVYLPGVVANEFANVTNMQFRYLKGLKAISPNLFKGAAKLTSINSTFQYDEELEEIPVNMFIDCPLIANFQNAFDGCKKLRNAPTFMHITKTTTSILAMFRNCESLVELPDQMFPETFLNKVTNFNSFFMNCKSLTRVPDTFFKGLGETVNASTGKPAAAFSNMNMVFSGCENLESVNMEQLFNTPSGLQTYSFTSMFADCGKLKGKVPTYKWEYKGATYDVAPWQRLDYIKSEDAEMAAAAKVVFGTRTSFNTVNAFSNCVSLDGYESIPSAWGGGDDGLSGLPQLTITPVLPEGKEYYQVDFVLKGKDVQELYYFLSTSEVIERNLPYYGNSLEQIVKEEGTKMTDSYNGFKVANVNTEEGITLGWEGGMPEVEYAIIVMAKNTRGSKTVYATKATQPMPRGSDAFEAYVGTWTVTPDGATSEVTAVGVPAPAFEITIVPNRVDENYAIYGWGYTILNQHPFMLWFNPASRALEMWNGQKGATNVVQNYKFGKEDNPDAKFSYYNAIYYPIIEDPNSGQLSYWSPSNNECILAGNYIKATDSVTLNGQRSASVSSDTGKDAYWAGMELLLGMGSQSGSQIWTPVQIVQPDKRFIYEGKEYTPYHYAPYKMTRKSTDVEAVKVAMRAAAAPAKGSLKVSGVNGTEQAIGPMTFMKTKVASKVVNKQ